MTRQPRRSPSLGRRLTALVSASVMVATLLATTASPVSATSIWRIWGAKLSVGTATLTRFWAGNGELALNLAGLTPSATYPVIVYHGTCANSIEVASLPAAVADASGAVTMTSPAGTGVLNSVWTQSTKTGVAIKIGTGSSALCAALRSAVATRIQIAALKINLPIVKPPSGYPLCNVAMYIKELQQPGEAGVTFIYAHARTGMFLPLLTRSKVNNGASLLGMVVRVWTSNDLLFTYQITKVRRHTLTLGNVFDLETPQLWLQTSEGPRGTKAKLVIEASLIGSEPATHAAAHPTPKPVICQ